MVKSKDPKHCGECIYRPDCVKYFHYCPFDKMWTGEKLAKYQKEIRQSLV